MKKNMKQVSIVYRNGSNKNAIDFIKSSLEEIFGQHIVFTNCFLKDLQPGQKLQADAFLALGDSVIHDLSDHVDDLSRVIKVNRSPDRKALKAISKIPAGTTVLIVNDTYESALDATRSFYEVGIGHINMVPYDSSLAHTGIYDGIEIAVTPSEPHLVPPQSKKSSISAIGKSALIPHSN